MYAEVIFPLKLKTFTYKVPPDAPLDLAGRIVRAALVNRQLYGIVSDVKETGGDIAHTRKIKEILSVHEHLGSPSFIPLLRWLSGYYLAPAGVGLSACFFKEAVSVIQKPRVHNAKKIDSAAAESPEDDPYLSKLPDSAGQNISLLSDAIQRGKFNTFLFHSPSFFYERGFLYDVLKSASACIEGAIVLVPEISQIEKIASMLKAVFGERVCTIHSKQGRKRRMETIRGLLSGALDILIGTRSAIFAPLKKVSFIAVINEHSPSYKAEEGLRYNGRDVAVMRGFLEKTPVLLSSICPSIESVHNAGTGKFRLLKASETNTGEHSQTFSLFSAKKRPRIEIINSYDAEKAGFPISREILAAAHKHLSKKENLLFIVSTKGYSLILCSDCGYIFRCSGCHIPLRFYKTEGILRCRLCGQQRNVSDSCQICGGIELSPLGAGTERIREDIEKFFKKNVLILDKNNQWLHRDNQLMPFVIGRRNHVRKLRENTFMVVVFFDSDLSLTEPNFTANERVFQSVMQVSQLMKPGGQIFIQTRHPGNKILSFIKNYDFRGFYKNELLLRRETDFPPFSRLALFNLYSNQQFDGLREEINRLLAQGHVEGVGILGPVEIPSPLKSYKYCLQVLLKSKDRKNLNLSASALKEKLNSLKGIKVATDVDPIKI